MKLILLKSNLKDGLEAIGRIESGSSKILPILKNFLIETVDNRIKLSATNLELAITIFIPGKIIEDGGLTIPFGVFNSIITNLQSERISLESENNNLIIKTDNYEAKIHGIKKEEFPIIPRLSGGISVEIPSATLKNALSFVVGAAQVSDLRPELNTILFNFQINTLKFAATDTFRLAEITLGENHFKSEINKLFKVIIPLRTIGEVIRVFKAGGDNINISFDPNQVLYKNENLEVISRLISAEFPNYQPIIPEKVETEVVLNKDELINALKLAASFTNQLNEVKIIIKDKAKNIEVFSAGQGLGENRYLIPAKIKGPALEIVFNWRFLLDGLKGFNSETVSLGLNGDDKPAIIKEPGNPSHFYILMPIKAV